MIWRPLDILIAHFGHPKAKGAAEASATTARRWTRAFREDPELVRDLIRMSGLLDTSAVVMTEGRPELAPVNPYALAVERGRQDFARLLLALGAVSIHDLNQLMENDYDA